MVSIFRNSETTQSIAIEGWMYTFTSLVLLISIFILLKHICNPDKCTNTHFKICAMWPLICSIILTTVAGMLFNNSVIPSINSHYSFIDKHCDFFTIICSSITHIIRYSTWIFYLYRIKHYFTNSEKYHLSTFSFGINIVVYTLITSVSMYLHYSWSNAVDSRFSAILYNEKYKCCRVSFDDNIELKTSVIITFMVNEGLISVYLLYLLYSKTINTEKEQQEHGQLSVHFSQRDTKNIINTKIMRRCIFFGMMLLLIQWSLILMAILFELNHALCICCCCIFNTIPILVSFDMENPIKLLCPFCNDNTDTENNGDHGIPQTELTQSQSEYMEKIMQAYYKVPSRQSRNIVINNHRN